MAALPAAPENSRPPPLLSDRSVERHGVSISTEGFVHMKYSIASEMLIFVIICFSTDMRVATGLPPGPGNLQRPPRPNDCSAEPQNTSKAAKGFCVKCELGEYNFYVCDHLFLLRHSRGRVVFRNRNLATSTAAKQLLCGT